MERPGRGVVDALEQFTGTSNREILAWDNSLSRDDDKFAESEAEERSWTDRVMTEITRDVEESGSGGAASTDGHGVVGHESDVEEEAFDFAAHRQQAIDGYQPLIRLYADFAYAVHSILRARVDGDSVKVNSIEHRAKTVESFGDKANRPSDEDPNRPKYPEPLSDITDLAGIRVITHFLSTEPQLDRIIESEFEVFEKTDRSQLLRQEERLGYHSIHYLVRLRPNRQSLPEYARFTGLVAELQVRTVLQHAWAEIEHDIQYKAATSLPAEIRRRFMTLAGLLEIADREFEAIQEQSKKLRIEALDSVAAGRLTDVEITPDALKAYLDARMGPDGRMRDFSYEWQARLLKRLGFLNLGQLDDAIAPYDDDEVSRVIHGGRQGQLTRLEGVLLAALGEEFVRRHPWTRLDAPWYHDVLRRHLERLEVAGVPMRTYDPENLGPLGS
jgi:ppGpp synthetase/RelA/SpoT-type nucleotidyltranferase